MARRRALVWMPRAVVVAGFALAGALACAQAALPERDLKAQIVVRSLLFVEWPPGTLVAGQPLVLCVADGHPVGEAMERMAGQAIHGTRLEVRRTTGAALAGCQVVMARPATLAAIRQAPRGVLVVSDAQGGLDQGAMLQLQAEQERIVFDVDLSTLRAAGLDINSRLLRLARYVRRD